MAGDFMSEAEAKERGLNRNFNSYTLRGRFNWVCLTYGTIFGLIALNRIRKMFAPCPPPDRSRREPRMEPQLSPRSRRDSSRSCGCRE